SRHPFLCNFILISFLLLLEKKLRKTSTALMLNSLSIKSFKPKRKENYAEIENSKHLIVMQDAIIEEFMNLSIMLKEGKLNI
ncbi:hypothetical protein ACSLPB_29495, partial [Escherichia coli]|uniref:hypothetical protein n=1 Tax=Escherichia coli TaxID=562 RepID=UPI003EE00F4F